MDLIGDYVVGSFSRFDTARCPAGRKVFASIPVASQRFSPRRRRSSSTYVFGSATTGEQSKGREPRVRAREE
jgi:hypothetical protein